MTLQVEWILGRYPYTYVFTSLNNYIQRRSEIQVLLRERCMKCKNNWDGHCIVGNDSWKARNSNKEVECEEYEEEDE